MARATSDNVTDYQLRIDHLRVSSSLFQYPAVSDVTPYTTPQEIVQNGVDEKTVIAYLQREFSRFFA